MAAAPSGAGAMTRLLSWQKRVETNPDAPDDYGNTRSDWAEQYRCHSRRIPMRGGEGVQASRLQGTQPYVLQIRQCEAARLIRTDWRAVDTRSGQILQVKTITDPDDRGAYLDIMVVEGVAA
ncbi:MAG: head-tail adaptor protein [Ferrovibrio sp.]|uniref:head-tail adaptor protein n=1 Tax=Ferrovibrio sp. TaxID=1917215 RepID=UPI002626710D|nr:head-tail adaptor protein [Ferrovibrio sp.]MCW0235277.1 head-tail adaptor protein [Ferrovibrio sp.]